MAVYTYYSNGHGELDYMYLHVQVGLDWTGPRISVSGLHVDHLFLCFFFFNIRPAVSQKLAVTVIFYPVTLVETRGFCPLRGCLFYQNWWTVAGVCLEVPALGQG